MVLTQELKYDIVKKDERGYHAPSDNSVIPFNHRFFALCSLRHLAVQSVYPVSNSLQIVVNARVRPRKRLSGQSV